MKILINTPDWRRPALGGVANHYYGLRPYWTEQIKYQYAKDRFMASKVAVEFEKELRWIVGK